MSDQTPNDPKDVRDSKAAAESAEDAARRAEQAAADAARERDDALALAHAARVAAVEAARKAGRFSREFFVTVISVVTTAFGVVVALAWNTALSEWLKTLQKGTQTIGYFIYALLITFLAVIAIVILSRVAKRIKADPVEFKIGTTKTE